MPSIASAPARPPRRRGFTRCRLLVLAAAALITALVAVWLIAGDWAPSRADYPVQGIAVDASDGPVDWSMARGAGADFAYLLAAAGPRTRDARFAANWAGAREAGLRYGAVHRYSLCASASDQARLFIATVPRDNAALPPAVALDLDGGCAARPNRDQVLSELNVFLNEIEAHGGKPAILRVSPAFEDAYAIGAGINRTLWVDRPFIAPGNGARGWVMWTANPWHGLAGQDGRVEWTVVRP